VEFNPESCRNETEVESKFLVQYLLPKLGYTADAWYQEVALGSIRLDFMVLAARAMLKGIPNIRLVMEAKHPNRNLDRHVLRLRTYLQTLGARYGLLTNGKQLRVYELSEGRLQLIFECLGAEVEANLNHLRALIGSNSKLEKRIPTTSHKEERAGLPMQTIAIYHNKGGVGKTTAVVNLAAALSKRGYRITSWISMHRQTPPLRQD
jgi:hypothetical protein